MSSNNSQTKNQIIKEATYYNIGNFIYLGAQWIISVALVRMGGLEDAGYFSLAMSVCNMFAMIANYGLRAYQVSDIKEKYSDNDYVASRILTVFAAFVMCLVYTVAFQKTAFKISLILLYMVYKCIEAYSDVLTAVFQKNGKMIYVGASLGAKGLLNLTLFIAFYLLTKNLVVSVAFMSAGSLVVLLGFDFIKLKPFYKQTEIFKNINVKKTAALLGEGFLLMLYVFSMTAFNSIPKLIIEKKESAESLGVFSSVAIPTVIITTFAAGMLIPIVPKLSEYFDSKDNKRIFKTFGTCAAVIILIGALAAVFSALVGRPIFKLLFGEVILPHFILLYYMIISSVLIALNSIMSTFLTAVRKLKQEFLFSLMSCVLVLVLSLLLIDGYGIYGAAYAMIITLLIQFVFETAYVVMVIQKNCKEKN